MKIHPQPAFGILAAAALCPLLLLPTACTSGDSGDPGESSDPVAEGVVGFGSLRLVESIPVHPRPFSIASADLDGDGLEELLVGGPALTVLSPGHGPGFRRAPGTPFADLIDATDLAVADFDEDGIEDIAIAEHDAPEARYVVLLGSSEGGFAPAPDSPFYVDAVPHLHTLAAADFDGDGHIDLVTDSWPESKLVFVRGQGDGGFDTPGASFRVPEAPMQNLRSADMNGDGRPDIVVPAHDSGAVSVLLGQGDGRFAHAEGSPFASFEGFSTLTLADMDGDGDADAVEVHRRDLSTQYKIDGLSVLLNDGEGRLSHAPHSPHRGLPGRSSVLAVADLDGDPWLDVAVLGETEGELAVLLGSEEGLHLHSTSKLPGRCLGVTAAKLEPGAPSRIVLTDLQGARVLVFEFVP